MAIVAVSVALVAVLAGVLFSERVQSLLVFVQWLNWPPISWSDPEQPSPTWARTAGSYLSWWTWSTQAFEGLPGARPLSVESAAGTLRGWRIPGVEGGGPRRMVVLYLHGNAGNMAVKHRVLLYQLLAAAPLSCDVVTFDYRGFGRSDGWWPNEATAVADATALWRSLRDEDPNSQVVVWGHSLGTGVALGLLSALVAESTLCSVDANGGAAPAACVEPSGKSARSGGLPWGLILEAPFTSVPDVALFSVSRLPRSLVGWLSEVLHRLLSAHRFPSKERVERVAHHLKNVAILHGAKDTVVPYQHGQELARLAQVPLYTFAASGHENIVLDPELVQTLGSIFEGWGSAPSQ